MSASEHPEDYETNDDDSWPPAKADARTRELLDDPRAFPLTAYAARWEASPLLRPPPTLAPHVGEPPLGLSPARLPARFAADAAEEYALPPELYQSLSVCVPQALLRDLHRPVQRFSPAAELREGSEWGLIDEVYRDMLAAQAREGVPDIEPLVHVMREILAHRRRIREEPWRPYKADDAPRDAIDLDGGAGDFFQRHG